MAEINILVLIILAFGSLQFTSAAVLHPAPIKETSTNFLQFSIGEVTYSNCTSHKYFWQCCASFFLKDVGNVSFCSTLAYLEAEYGVEIKLTANEFVIVDEHLSLLHPRALCAGVPTLKQYLEVCIELYRIAISKTEVDGCIQVYGKIFRARLFHIEMGCFRIPVDNIQVEQI